jgi:hypothetical protein
MAGTWVGGGIKHGRLGNPIPLHADCTTALPARGNRPSFGPRYAQARYLQTEQTSPVCGLPVQIGISPLVGATESRTNNRGKTWTTVATNHS